VDVDPGPTAADTELHRSDFQPPGQQRVLTTTNVFLVLLIDHHDAAAEDQLPQKGQMPAGVRGVFSQNGESELLSQRPVHGRDVQEGRVKRRVGADYVGHPRVHALTLPATPGENEIPNDIRTH
jgi:hypothetical protein